MRKQIRCGDTSRRIFQQEFKREGADVQPEGKAALKGKTQTNVNAIIRVPSFIERAWMLSSSPRSGGGTRRLVRRGEPTGLVPPGSGG